jgi:hypothetical protein
VADETYSLMWNMNYGISQVLLTSTKFYLCQEGSSMQINFQWIRLRLLAPKSSSLPPDHNIKIVEISNVGTARNLNESEL